MNYGVLKLSDIPPAKRRDGVTINGQRLTFTEQITGYGVRKLFECPDCGARRLKLVVTGTGVYCAGCAPVGIYRRRRNLYDTGGTALIEHQMHKLAASVGITIHWPFDYALYALSKPKRGTRWALKQLQMLENMRSAAIFFKRRFSPGDIKRRITPESLARYTLEQLRDYIIME